MYELFWTVAKTFENYGGAITAAATLAITFLTLFLWWSTHKLWQEARDASVIAKQAADAATKSAKVAEIALVLTQRAWVATQKFECKVIEKDAEGNRQWKLGIVWENTGATYAVDASGGAFVMEVPRGQEVSERSFGVVEPVEARARLVIGARGTARSGGVGGKTNISEAQIRQAQEGAITLFLCGTMDYRDIFPASPPRHTKVCMRIGVDDPSLNKSNPFSFNAYHKYNEAT